MSLWDEEKQRAKDRRAVIQFGDEVVLYGGRERVTSIRVERNQCTNHKFGVFRHNDIAGKRYGDRACAEKAQKLGKHGSGRQGFLTLLLPSPELFRQGPLSRQTQILFTRDISHIMFMLEVSPGKVVVESGTGTGSFSMSLARGVAPTGHLYTYEFHEARADIARKQFKSMGLSSMVTVEHRDVCEDGFGRAEASVDAVFLDLPSPWLAVGHAHHCLRADSPICSFSPCIEQVQRTCEAMRELGFTDITTVECLIRPFDVLDRSEHLPEEEFEFLARGHFRSGHEKVDEQQRTSTMPRPVATTEIERGGSELVEMPSIVLGKHPRSESDSGDGGEDGDEEGDDGGTGSSHTSGAPRASSSEAVSASTSTSAVESASSTASGTFASKRLPYHNDMGRSLITKNVSEVRGHTSFLTFARRAPR